METSRPLPFTTARIEDGIPWFWEEHEARIQAASVALGLNLPRPNAMRAALPRVVGGSMRLRMTAQPDGSVVAEAAPYEPPSEPWTLKVVPVDHDADAVRHKTTARTMYDAARNAAPDHDDALLVDLDGRVLETTIANVVVQIDGDLRTPPSTLALLPGIARARLLEAGVAEAVIDETELRRAEAVCVCNALMGVHPVGRIGDESPMESGDLARHLHGSLRIQG